MGRLVWHGDARKVELRGATAEILLKAAVIVQTEHKIALNRPYPPASKKGEYPAKRTGVGQASVVYEPTSKAAIEQTSSVKFGYLTNAFYMSILEVFRGRKGLIDTLKRLRSKLASLR